MSDVRVRVPQMTEVERVRVPQMSDAKRVGVPQMSHAKRAGDRARRHRVTPSREGSHGHHRIPARLEVPTWRFSHVS